MKFVATAEVTLKDSILVLPAVSVGNVGQLAVDLLLNTFKLTKVGYLLDDTVVPTVTNDALDLSAERGTLYTSLEVYQSSSPALTVIQQRAPLRRRQRREFVERVVKFAQEQQCGGVVVLASADSTHRVDSQITGEPLRQLSWGEWPVATRLGHMGVRALERPDTSLTTVPLKTQYSVPGGGVTADLHDACERARLPSTALVLHCAPGYNIPDAMLLASCAGQALGLVHQPAPGEAPGTFAVPAAWERLLEDSAPMAIY
eukprot:Colp12_sorted_trinity150504_noHs@31304